MQLKISFICLVLFVILASLHSQARAGPLDEETTRAQTKQTQVTTRAQANFEGDFSISAFFNYKKQPIKLNFFFI